MDVAVHGIVHRGDVLGVAGDGGVCHDGIGVWGFINGFELQPLVMDPKVWRFDIFGVALVLVGAVHGFAGSSFPGRESKGDFPHLLEKATFPWDFLPASTSFPLGFEFCTQAPLTPQSTS